MPAPRELSQQIPAPGQKLGCESPKVGENFWCQSPGVRGRGEGWLWMKLIPALIHSLHLEIFMQVVSFF